MPVKAGGPIVAPRQRFEGTVSYDPEADTTPTIRSRPDAPEAGRLRALMIASSAAGPRGVVGPVITWR